MKIVTISSKNQITLPKNVLVSLGIKPSGKLIVEEREKEIVLRPIKTSIVAETAGCLSRYVSASKKGKSYRYIIEQTKKIVAKHLDTKS